MQKIVDGNQTDSDWVCVDAGTLELGVKVGYYMLKAWDIIKQLPPP